VRANPAKNQGKEGRESLVLVGQGHALMFSFGKPAVSFKNVAIALFFHAGETASAGRLKVAKLRQALAPVAESGPGLPGG
jgi:hypothetical protein